MRSGTSLGLRLDSPAALRVELKWSVSHSGDWCVGEAGHSAPPSGTLHVVLQTSSAVVLVLVNLC